MRAGLAGDRQGVKSWAVRAGLSDDRQDEGTGLSCDWEGVKGRAVGAGLAGDRQGEGAAVEQRAGLSSDRGEGVELGCGRG